MKRKKVFYVKYNWQTYFKETGFRIPEEVPVRVKSGENLSMPAIVDGFIYLMEKRENLKYLEEFKDFIINICLSYSENLSGQGEHEQAVLTLKELKNFYTGSDLINLRISQHYFDAGFPREAQKYIVTALKLNPGSSMILTYAGVIKAAIGNVRQAETLWKKAVQLKKDYRKAWLNLSNLYNFQGKYQKNIQLYRENPEIIEFPEIANQLGISFASMRRYDEAIGLFEQAKKSSEVEIPYLDFNLAQAHMDAKNWKKSLELYKEIYRRSRNEQTRKSLEERINFLNSRLKNPEVEKPQPQKGGFSFAQLAKEEEYYLQIMKNIEQMKKEAAEDPNNPWVYYNLGNLYAQLGKFDDAVDQLQHSLELYEENSLVWHTLGLIYLEMKKVDKALNAIQRAVICRPDPEVESIYQKMNFNLSLPYFNLGDVYIRRKKYPEALHAFLKGLEIDARSFLAHFRVGFLYEYQGDQVRAEEEYRKSLMLNQGFPEVYLKLGELLIKKGKKDEGLLLLQRLLSLSPESREARKATNLLKKHG
ncbi:MAG: tetratricopeptide repeat protein [Candidatus Wallbacteria bacterium]|nr:tetratricopeptide repeat protein [Candidatus Wallbacteria bacterium]